MSRPIDPGHEQVRDLLRVLGPAVVLLGVILTGVGIGSFFAAFGSFEPPRYFWCAFLGMPLIALGSALCKFAFMGAVTRYMADEVAPVGKDVVNYMADGTKDAIHDVAEAVGKGFHAGMEAKEAWLVRCHKCNTDNESTARFCKECGTPLAKTRRCAHCGELNDPDAKYCDNCGTAMA